jgi:diguanylate cyclase (GGDEF)-like protein/PAS domain S-box-containing protein
LGWRAQADAYRADDMQVIESGRGKFLIEEPQTTPIGDTITLLTSKIPLRDASGSIAGVLGTYLDITDRKRAEEALRASEAKYLDLFQSTRDAILTLSPVSMVFESANPAAVRLFGAENEAALCSMRPWELSPERQPGGRASVDKSREMLDTAMRVGSHLFEWTHRRADGSEFPADVLLTRVTHGRDTLLYATIRDITDRKNAEVVIARMARYDALTGLANRRVFVENLELAMARCRRGEKDLAVLYLDLDHFKDVNDTLGHPVGDELLKAVADRLHANVREVDTVARFGGDEFAVVMSEVADPAEAASLADKLLNCLAEPFHIGGNEIRTGSSIGIATYDDDAPDAETILSHADVALYRAKNEGRGTFRFFTDAMDREVKSRVTLGAELREALAEKQFTLYYQPEVDTDTGKIIGLEALVRWQHPRRGLLAPAEFIPAAEASGLISGLGRWILRDACRQAREWIDLGTPPGFIAVNVSALQFKSVQDLENDIAAAQAEFKLPPRMLELELTETVLMDATRRNTDVLTRLRDEGVRIAIDDFGTGYSSLGYLRKLPVDRIKIPQTFVAEIDNEPNACLVVKAALGLARELGLGAVVEGVQTRAQLEALRSWGCRQAQGFYFAEPQPPQQITELLRAGMLHPSSRQAPTSPPA